MTKQKHYNSLNIYLKSLINQSLNLEYAIRAAHILYPEKIAQLVRLNDCIVQSWRILGASDDEISREHLVELAWDTIQIGFQMRHKIGLIYPPELKHLIETGTRAIQEKYANYAKNIDLPIADFYRISDLLSGANSMQLMATAGEMLAQVKAHQEDDDIELRHFIHGFRTPVPLHPNINFVMYTLEDGSFSSFGLLLDLKLQSSLTTLNQQLGEFLYQFAQFRASRLNDPSGDGLCHEIVDAYLENDLKGSIDGASGIRFDGLVSAASGLAAWDLTQQYEKDGKHGPRLQAIHEVYKKYPSPDGKIIEESTVTAHYWKTKERIEELVQRFEDYKKTRILPSRSYPSAAKAREFHTPDEDDLR